MYECPSILDDYFYSVHHCGMKKWLLDSQIFLLVDYAMCENQCWDRFKFLIVLTKWMRIVHSFIALLITYHFLKYCFWQLRRFFSLWLCSLDIVFKNIIFDQCADFSLCSFAIIRYHFLKHYLWPLRRFFSLWLCSLDIVFKNIILDQCADFIPL